MPEQRGRRPGLHMLRGYHAVCLLTLATHAAVSPVLAEVRTVSARGEYRMGDRDTKDDAIRLAIESAKRSALEQVAVYLESVTVAEGADLTKDEIRAYTAGLVIVLDQRITTMVDGDAVTVRADLLAQIDTEEAAQAIAALRKNEDVRAQLAALKHETERLRQELDGMSRALADASTPDRAWSAAQRREILYRVQSHAMVSQAWTDWALVLSESSAASSGGSRAIQLLLQAARDLYPASPYVGVAEQVMGRQRPPVKMPRYEIAPPPGFRGGARTLNEFVYGTPERPAQKSGSGSPVQTEQSSRRLVESDAGENTVEGSMKGR